MKTYKEFSEQAYSSKSQIDEGLGTILKLAKKPVQRLAKGALNWFNKGKNTRIPNEAQARFGTPLEYFKKNPNPKTLFGDDALQRGLSNKAYKAGEKPGLLGRPDRAFGVDIPQSIKQRRVVGVPASQGGPGSGPTPITREIVKRPIRSLKGLTNN
jgi:hypothetical protein